MAKKRVALVPCPMWCVELSNPYEYRVFDDELEAIRYAARMKRCGRTIVFWEM